MRVGVEHSEERMQLRFRFLTHPEESAPADQCLHEEDVLTNQPKTTNSVSPPPSTLLKSFKLVSHGFLWTKMLSVLMM